MIQSGVGSKGTECSGVEFSNRDLGAYRQQSASTEYGILARYKYVLHLDGNMAIETLLKS